MEHIPELPPAISAFTDFMIVAIHSILYYRDIYAKRTFLWARMYNLKVPQSRHLGLCQHIVEIVSAAENELLDEKTERLIVLIYEGKFPRERFVVDIAEFCKRLALSRSLLLSETRSEEQREVTLPVESLAQQLRATISRLATCCESVKGSAGKGALFTLAIEKAKGEDSLPRQPQSWVKVEGNEQLDPSEGEPSSSSLVVREVRAGILAFKCWYELAQDRPSALIQLLPPQSMEHNSTQQKPVERSFQSSTEDSPPLTPVTVSF